MRHFFSRPVAAGWIVSRPNPEGDPGAKTRNWFSLKDQPIMAWTGFCRNTPEFGPVFAGMTTEANSASCRPMTERRSYWSRPSTRRVCTVRSRDVIGFLFRPPVAASRMVVTETKDCWRSVLPLAALQPTCL